jgi:PAS domain S-box-containing protein
MYRAIADFAGMGIMLVQEKKVIYSNQQIQKFLELNTSDLTLRKFYQWILPADRDNVLECLLNSSDSEQKRFRFEFRSQQDNVVRHYRALTQEIEYEGRPAIHLICDDITEQKRHELKMLHNDRLSTLGTMAAGIAHELNQPLNTIRVVTDGFLFGRDEEWDLDPDELYESLDLVSKQVLRMTQVIQNIRDFAREERNGVHVDVDINEALENVFSMIGRQLEAHGIELKTHFGQGMPPVRADLYQLEQVFMNLLVNARQALDASESSKKVIAVRTSYYHGKLQIEVIDNAIGIHKEKLNDVFEPFYTTKEPGVGTGLGLSISQSIISGFGGQIKVYNNYSGGATFVVLIPLGDQ